MAVYWLSYRIHEDETGDERRENLVNEVQNGLTLTDYWHETTSFIVFNSTARIDVLARRFKSQIDPKVDLFLMRAMESKLAYICGHYQDLDIFNLMVRGNGSTYLRPI
jgi:hypothetical protein